MLTFVNTIAEIVHSQVHTWGGQCNKNLGNAFVIVWRIGDEKALMAANAASIMSRKQSNLRANSMEGTDRGTDRASVTDRNSSVSGFGGRSDSPSVTDRKRWVSNSSNQSGDTPSNPKRKTFVTRFMSNSDSQSHDIYGDDESVPTNDSPAKKSQKSSKFNVDLKRVPGVDQMADGALIGYLKVIAEINRSAAVLKYRTDKRLTSKARDQKTQLIAETDGAPPSSAAGETRDKVETTFMFGSGKVGSFTPTKLVGRSSFQSPVKSRSITGTGTSLFNVPEGEEEDQINKQDIVDDPAAEEEISAFLKSHDNKEQSLAKAEETSDFQEFKVRMGFGLHAGWAIEGAVGSTYKVDATYLSPHVNMAARLETSSRQYKVPILMSHFFHELLSETPQKKCRKVDVVTVKGSEVPIGIYTYDCFQDQNFTESSPSAAPLTAKTLHKLISVAGLASSSSKVRSVARTKAKSITGRDSPLLQDPARSRTPGADSKEEEETGRPSRRSTSSPSMNTPTDDFVMVNPMKRRSLEGNGSGSPVTQPKPPLPPVGSPVQQKPSATTLQNTLRSIELDENMNAASPPASPVPETPTNKDQTTSRRSTPSSTVEPRNLKYGGQVANPGKLPLPPMSTHHSAASRALLSQVHRELLSIQREVERIKEEKHVMEEFHRSHPETRAREDDEDVDYAAVEDYLKQLFPDAEIVIPPQDDTSEVFLRDIDLLQLRCHINDRFFDIFTNGVNEYIKGNWNAARIFLEDANSIMVELQRQFKQSILYKESIQEKLQKKNQQVGPVEESVIKVVNRRLSVRSGRRSSLSALAVAALSQAEDAKVAEHQHSTEDSDEGDGPSSTLLNYMKGFNYVAPSDWKGFRPLTSK